MKMLLLSLQLALVLVITNARAEDSPIALYIAVPTHNGERRIDNIEHIFQDNTAHFDVVVANTSDKPQRIWREWCSWGYFGLTFEFTDENSKKWVAEKEGQIWTVNAPDWWTLEPHESLVIEVYFADSKIWRGFPSPDNGSQTVTMQAILKFKPDHTASQNNIWTGRVVSKPEKVIFSHLKVGAEGA